MANVKVPRESIQATINALAQCGGNQSAAARLLNLDRKSFLYRLSVAKAEGFTPKLDDPAPFQSAELPNPDEPLDELLERRSRDFERRDRAEKARKLIPIKVNIEGPFAITHFGDPHIDDDGCNLPLLRRHLEIIKDTEAMFGANVGDLQNNWIGRIAYLYAQQEASASTAWRLVEWMMKYIDWLYLIGGNHDNWSGSGDPLDWIMRGTKGVFDHHGARLNLLCLNGTQVRINARHDFSGHSMWNPTHGPLKAAMMGWRDHILSCGHKHTSGYQLVKDPASGLISHILRVAGFKTYDRYAKEKGLPDAAFYPSATTIIDPDLPDDDIGKVTVIHDVEKAARFLEMLRKDWRKPKKKAA